MLLLGKNHSSNQQTHRQTSVAHTVYESFNVCLLRVNSWTRPIIHLVCQPFSLPITSRNEVSMIIVNVCLTISFPPLDIVSPSVFSLFKFALFAHDYCLNIVYFLAHNTCHSYCTKNWSDNKTRTNLWNQKRLKVICQTSSLFEGKHLFEFHFLVLIPMEGCFSWRQSDDGLPSFLTKQLCTKVEY